MHKPGPLLAADEQLTHQIVDTFARVGQTDRAWTEKIWASIARTDGSLQLDFGLGKYHNRGILYGFGGVSFRSQGAGVFSRFGSRSRESSW